MSNVDLRPTLGCSADRVNNLKILLVCFYDPNGISTIWENIGLLKKHSMFQFDILNLWPGRSGHLTIPPSVRLDDFSGIFIHPTACYSIENLKSLDSALMLKFKDYKGVKIIAKQDEHFMTEKFDDYISENAFDIFLTCVPERELPKAYPKCIQRKVIFLETLTGYVSEFLRSLSRPSYDERIIDVCYRGSYQPVSFGRLGFEKWFIGSQFDRHLGTGGLIKDISSRWDDRKNGVDWFSFLSSSKAVLGVESGSNLFDFDGSVQKLCSSLIFEKKLDEIFSEKFYNNTLRPSLLEFEGNVDYAQISPRHFEACATGTLQILYEGRYSDIFKPYEHYIPLRRDLANIDEVIQIIQDPKKWQLITETAYRDIIKSEQFTYASFVKKFDSVLAGWLSNRKISIDGLEKLGAIGAESAKFKRILNLCAHDPVVDPRISWHSNSLTKNNIVIELGTYGFKTKGSGPFQEKIDNRYYRVKVEKSLHGSKWSEKPLHFLRNVSIFQNVMMVLRDCISADVHTLKNRFGAYDADEVDLFRFRDLCRYVFDTNAALFEAAMDIGRCDVIVCADLESLPAAIGLKEVWGCKVLFDSHEFWPFSYLEFRHWENEFWSRVECALARSADVCATVSVPLAKVLSGEYGVQFYTLPNAVPLRDAPLSDEVSEAISRREQSTVVKFLFQGNFAPGRGLDTLISNWGYVSEKAILLLRGPDNSYRQEMISLAQSLGLFEKTVFFVDAVREEELVRAALTADVGVIPYDPRNYANKFACPNKLSQYMAAGIPILANQLEYVSSIIEASNCGIAVNFLNHEKMISAVNYIVESYELRRQWGSSGRKYFESHFNWDTSASKVYEELLCGVEASCVTAEIGKVEFSKNLSVVAEEENIHVAVEDFPVKQSVEFSLNWRGPLLAAINAVKRTRLGGGVGIFWHLLPAWLRRMVLGNKH